MDFEATSAKVWGRAALARHGYGSDRLRGAVASGQLVRAHAGWYVAAAEWGAAYPEERHLMQVVAADASMRGSDTVAALCSAAVLWELPVFRTPMKRVHLAGGATDGVVTKATCVSRHEFEVAAEDRTTRFGIPCTSLARTVFDVVRFVSFEAGVACADAAMRRIAWSSDARAYDEEAAEAWRESMRRRLVAARGARGIRRAREVIEFADGRAHLPGESVSRVYLHWLGFAPPGLQVPVPAPGGRSYFVDFGLDDASAWGEFDGVVKYQQLALAADATPNEIFDAEKSREDWIRGTTQRPLARWGMRHLASARTLGSRLANFHIHPRR